MKIPQIKKIFWRKPRNNFLIISSPRSGSTYLHTLLASHPNVNITWEPFNLTRPKKVLNSPTQLLTNIFDLKYPRTIKSVGFKILYSQLTLEDYSLDKSLSSHQAYNNRYNKARALIQTIGETQINKNFQEVWKRLQSDKTIKVIHLKRKNMLETYLSLQLALKTNKWDDWDPKEHQKISINYEECVEFFLKTQAFEDKYTNFFKNHNVLDVFYEDLLNHKTKTLRGVQDFLNLPHHPLTSKLKKQGRSPRSSIVNYAALERKFKPTPWHGFFKQ